MRECKIVKTAYDKGYRMAVQKMREMSVRGWETVNIRPKDGSVLITFQRER